MLPLPAFPATHGHVTRTVRFLGEKKQKKNKDTLTVMSAGQTCNTKKRLNVTITVILAHHPNDPKNTMKPVLAARHVSHRVAVRPAGPKTREKHDPRLNGVRVHEKPMWTATKVNHHIGKTVSYIVKAAESC